MNDNKNIKPIEVKSEWKSPSKLNNKQELLIQLAIIGSSTAHISDQTGYSQEHVRKLMKATNIAEKIRTERETRFTKVLKGRMDDLCGLAAETLEKVLTSSEERGSVKVQTACYLLDHHLGKAKATMDVRTGSLTEFMDLVKEMQKDPKYQQPAQPREAWDDVIEEIIPKDMVVGLRKKD